MSLRTFMTSIFLKLGQIPWQLQRMNPFFPMANSFLPRNRHICIYRYDARGSGKDQRKCDTDYHRRACKVGRGIGRSQGANGSEEDRPLSFLPVAEEDLQSTVEFVPDGSERIDVGFLRAGDGRRVGESPVNPVRLPEEDGADLLGAEGDHGVDGPGVDGIQSFGSMTGDVDADLLEDLNCARVDGGGGRPGGRDLHPRRCKRASDPLGHRTAG